MTSSVATSYQFTVAGETHQVSLYSENDGYRVKVGDRQMVVQAEVISDNCLLLDLDGCSVTIYLAEEKGKIYIATGGRQFVVERVGEPAGGGISAQTQAFHTDHALTSPMPGQVVKITVREGDLVDKDQTVAIVEAMKMENELRASGRARVKKILAAAGDLVDAGQIIVELEPDE